jgi:tetratricopeptide (TPR) repeat protein
MSSLTNNNSTSEQDLITQSIPNEIDLQTAKEYLDRGEWDKALTCCKQILELQPDLWEVHQQMGYALLNLKHWKAAVTAYNRSLKINPDSALSYANLGSAYGKLQKWTEVIKCYETVDALSPDFWQNDDRDYDNHHKLGDFLCRHAFWQEAIVAYRRALFVNPTAYWSIVNLGKALMQLSSWQDAVEQFYRAIEIDPHKIDTYYYLGETLSAQELWTEAIGIYRHARQIDSDSTFVFGKLQDIATLLEKQIELNPDSDRAYYLLGEIYAELSHWGKALDAYERAYQLNFESDDLQEKIDRATKQKEKNQLGGIGNYLFCNLATDNPFIARITDIEIGGIIQGWAINNDRPEQSLKLQIRVDNHEIAKIETGNLCKDIVREELTSHPRKFQFQIPVLLAQKLLFNDELHLIEIVPIAESEEGLQPIVVELKLPRRSLGHIDNNTANNLIKGWALPDGHNGVAKLDIYVDDLFYATIEANLSRHDLVKYGLGNGSNGFQVAIPYSTTKNKQMKVDITFSNTQQKLNKRPIVLEAIEEEKSETDDRLLRSQLSRLARDVSRGNDRGVTIIIPIFNAYDEVRACLESVVEQTSIAARLLLINDASTDERIPSLLEWAKTYSNVHVINNDNNLGYTKTINVGIKWAGNDDIVLLNSDTIVGSRWLQNLQIAAYHEQDIATVTAMSDNAGAFSVPTMGRANELPKWLTFTELTRAIARNCENVYPKIPTGNGFCLYIRRAVFDRIGLFDEVTLYARIACGMATYSRRSNFSSSRSFG